MGSDANDRNKLEYEAVLKAEDAARYFERIAEGIREHVMLVQSGGAAVELDVSSNVKIELEVSAGRKESSIEVELSWRPGNGRTASTPDLRVVPGDTANHLDDDDYEDSSGIHRDERTGTPSGQLPLPEAPPSVAPRPEDNANEPPGELGDIAADDVREADVEASVREFGEVDDVFAENAEVAFESRTERARPDAFLTTPEGELRDAADVMPDTALTEPHVEAGESMGESSIGGPASTPSVADEDVDPASPDMEPRDRAPGERRNRGAPFSEVTPEEFDKSA